MRGVGFGQLVLSRRLRPKMSPRTEYIVYEDMLAYTRIRLIEIPSQEDHFDREPLTEAQEIIS